MHCGGLAVFHALRAPTFAVVVTADARGGRGSFECTSNWACRSLARISFPRGLRVKVELLPEHPKNLKRKFTTHCNGAWVRKGLDGDRIYLVDQFFKAMLRGPAGDRRPHRREAGLRGEHRGERFALDHAHRGEQFSVARQVFADVLHRG